MSWAVGTKHPKTRKPGPPWMGCYRDATGRQRTKSGFRLKEEAKAWGAEQEALIRKGLWIDPAGPKMKVKDWVATWQASRRSDGRGAALDATIIKCQILPKWGDRAIGSIKPIEVKTWVNDLAATAAGSKRSRRTEPYNPSTIRKFYALFKRIMEAAVEDGTIPLSPCRLKAGDLPALRATERPMLTPAECVALIQAAPSREQAMIHTALYTGMRWGELAALRWGDVDLVDGVVLVQASLEDINGQQRFKTTKSGRSRVVDLHPRTRQALSDHKLDHCKGRDADTDLVFTTVTGRTLRHGNYYNLVWLPTLERAGIGKRLTFHALRGVHLSSLLHNGVDALTVAERAGHTQASLTLNVYGRRNLNARQAVTDGIDRFEGEPAKLITDSAEPEPSPETLGRNSTA